MVFGRAAAANGRAVGRSRVSFIGVPGILRKFFAEAAHPIVAVGFGEYTGGGDVGVFVIAFDDAAVWGQVVGRKSVAIYEDESRRGL